MAEKVTLRILSPYIGVQKLLSAEAIDSRLLREIAALSSNGVGFLAIGKVFYIADAVRWSKSCAPTYTQKSGEDKNAPNKKKHLDYRRWVECCFSSSLPALILNGSQWSPS